jgi:DNA-binding transcriptional MerR regulator
LRLAGIFCAHFRPQPQPAACPAFLFAQTTFWKGRRKAMSKDDLGQDVLSIKEFAELVGMTIPALRHYDKMGVFPPAQRGVEFENQYRYYAPTQITTVKMIRVLNEIGVPLDTIKKLKQTRTPEKMIKLLSRNRDKVADEMRFLQEVSAVINTFLNLLYEGISITETELTVCEIPEKRLRTRIQLNSNGVAKCGNEKYAPCFRQNQ